MEPLSILRCAVLLALAPALNAQTYTVLHNFDPNTGPYDPYLSGTIAQSRGGNLFSTAGGRDRGSNGKAFKITTRGSFTTVHAFHTGQEVNAGLTLGTDGQYYGVTTTGGTYGHGTVFKMTQNGTMTPLYSFHGGTDGGNPTAAPIESQAGDFYGTTEGRSGKGSVYKITRYGDFTLLHTFTGTPDGAHPYGPLVQGKDYFFYGTTELGGSQNAGTIFRVNRSGEFKVVYNFDYTHGAYPFAGLIQANDGNYYGVTGYGGSLSEGTVFKMTPDYRVSVLHSFLRGNDGGVPMGGLVQATDGKLYGTASGYGTADGGVLFRITTAGTYKVLHNFTQNTGIFPTDALIQHTNGVLYGMTETGGVPGAVGTFYSLDLGLNSFVTYLPTYGRAGALVQILGQGFTQDTTVSFNGVPASFTAVYPTYIRAFVPGGAITGPIVVQTPTASLVSDKVFVVHPH
jgi:uncharacterized repeat protein (TIGR03803 family)